ncbi:MAG TPA: ROK family protein [Fimbriimonadales bacterium]|nr:ROK family protein [Fimbriimonadales bacterium]
MSEHLIVGVDLGGTNVRAALVEPETGKIVGKSFQTSSHAKEGVEACVNSIVQVIREAMTQEGKINGIGMAVPGHIQGNIVRWAPNFRMRKDGDFEIWKNVPLGEKIEKEFGLPVVMGNDANLAAWGEYCFGTGGKKAKGFAMFTLGTGIGFGMVLTPECVTGGLSGATLLIGGNAGGAEGGHMVIVKDGAPHPSAVAGTVEAYCGVHAIIQRAQKKWESPKASILREISKNNPENINPKLLHEAAEKGDEASREVWRETGEYLGVGIANVINLFAPEIVALGGQIAKVADWILQPARESARKYSIPTLFADTKIVQAERIDDAGILGAAAFAATILERRGE